MGEMFSGCVNLHTLNVDGFDTENVTNMDHMFNGCSNLTELRVNGFLTDKVKYINHMFSGCTKLTELDLSSFDLQNIRLSDGEAVFSLFDGCKSLSVIHTPINIKAEYTVSLPLEEDTMQKWKDTNNNVYDILPVENGKSIVLKKVNEEEHPVTGDLDGDGNINIMDMMQSLNYVSKKGQLTDEQFAAADINGDGKVNLTDLMLLLNYISKKSSTL